MKRIFLLLMSIFLVNYAFAQKEANVWYVGNNIKMDFSKGGNPVISNGIIAMTGGNLAENTTSITDKNGNLVFAVIADQIYDGGKNPIFKLPTRTWDVTQGAMVFPVPGVDNKYYLCVMRQGNDATTPMAYYYEINVIGIGAKNIVVSEAKDLLANLTQAQAGVPKINSDFSVSKDYWLITHEKCTNNFKVFSVTSAGISLNSTQAVGPTLQCKITIPQIIDEIGVMKFNNCYTQMAYTIGGSVHLYDFDAKTGTLTFVNEVTSLSTDQPYGVEFSSNGSFLYVLTGMDSNHPGKIYSMPVDANGLGTAKLLGSTGGMTGGHLQIAPDGNIYYAIPQSWEIPGKGKIGQLTNANNGGVLNNNFYQSTKEPLNSNSSDQDQWISLEMPTFVKSFVSNIAKLKINGQSTTNTVCVGQTVDFEVEVDGKQVTVLKWEAKGANTKTASNTSKFTVLIANKGLTQISVKIQNDCGITRDVLFDVNAFDYVTADATIDMSTCPNPTLKGTSTTKEITTYEWYDGNPTNGGKLLAIAPAYQYKGTGDVWVQATGTVTNLGTDLRGNQAYGNASATGTTILVKEVLNINEVKFEAYTWSGSLAGKTWTVMLKNSAGTIVGSPVIGTFTGVNSEVVTVKGNGWINLPPDTYKLIYSGSINTIYSVTGVYFGSGKITATGGNFYGFKAEQVKALPCVIAKQIVIENCNITSLSAKETSDLVIYPNPFSTSITLNHIPTEVEKIQLVDVYGNVVEEVFNPSETIEMGQTLSSGTYFIQLHSTANVTTQKVIKIN